jgi:7-cyano-7-deazaguanine synthase
MNKVIILSGGLDSTILAYKLALEFDPKTIYALTFQYGQKHSIEVNKAITTCCKLGINHKRLDISFLGDLVSNVSSLIKSSKIEVPTIKEVLGDPQPNTEVPYRNMIMLSIALSYAQAHDADQVYTAIQCHDLYGYWDASELFIERINDVSNLNRKYKITIEAPFKNLYKTDEIKIGIKLNVPFEDTISCYNPNEYGESCGICATCAERIKAFIDNKIQDPAKYSINIDWNKLLM